MKFTATRETILAATGPLMALALRGMKKSGSANSLTLDTGRAGMLRLHSADDNAEMSTLSDATVEASGKIGVSAKRLNDIIRNLDNGTVINFRSDGDNLILSSGRSSFKINCGKVVAPITRGKSVKDTTAGSFTFKAGELRRLVECAHGGVAGLPDASALPQGVLLHLTGQRMRLVGTNGGRMVVTSADVATEQAAKMVLSLDTIHDIKVILTKADADDDVVVRWAEGVFHLTSGVTEYHAGILSQDYVDYEGVMSKHKLAPFTLSLEDLTGIVQRMLIVSTALTVSLEGRTLSISTEVSEGKKKGEECVESIELPADAGPVEPFSVTVNGQFFSDALAKLVGTTVHLSHVSGNGTPLTVLSANADTRIYIMPLRV